MTLRRDIIMLLGGAAAWPLAVRAQQGDRVRRIGVLMPYENDLPEAKTYVSAFTQGLAELGWTEGRNVRMDLSWAGGDINRIRALAQELIGLQPDIIVTTNTTPTVALQRETRTIPIVFANVGDPVARKLNAALRLALADPKVIRNFEQTDYLVFPEKADDRGGQFLPASGDRALGPGGTSKPHRGGAVTAGRFNSHFDHGCVRSSIQPFASSDAR
jgi:hypothetical protein